jgi:uracil-DNA glycosylase
MFDAVSARAMIDSHLDWWSLAGVDTPAGEAAVNWLNLAPPPAKLPEKAAGKPRSDLAARDVDVGPDRIFHQSAVSIRRASPVPSVGAARGPSPDNAVPAAATPMPADWAAFQRWLAEDATVPGSHWARQRILPTGSPGAPLMLLALCPELEDQDSGQLFTAAAPLLDAMLQAVGFTRAECYLAALALTRPPGGRIGPAELEALTPLLWHHLRLAAPSRLLVFGTDLCRLLTREDLSATRGRLLSVNHDGVNMEAVAIQHTVLLHDRPVRKAAAWDSLKLLARR